MNRTKIHIDQLFRRALGGMKMPVEAGDWAAMQQQLAAAQRSKKRRRVLWFILPVLLAGVAGGWWMWENKNAVTAPVVSNSEKQVIIPGNNKAENSAKNNNQNNTTAARQETSSSTKNINTPDEKNAVKEDKNIQQNTTQKSTGKKTEQSPQYNTTRKMKEVGKTVVKPIEETTGEKTVTAEKENTITEEPLPAATQPGEVIAKNDTALEKEAEKDETHKDKTTAPLVKKATKSFFSIGVNAGITQNRFDVKNNKTYDSIRSMGDSRATGFNAFVTANMHINKWTFTSGLGVQSINGGGSYSYSKHIYDSIPVYDPNGKVIGYFYTNHRDTALNYSLNNSFTYITLPIGASYSTALTPKTGITLGLGVEIMYMAGAKGGYINPVNLYTFDSKPGYPLLKRWNAGLALTVGGYYAINKKITFDIAANVRESGSLLGKNAGAVIRPTTISLQMGLRYRIKN